MFQLPAVSYPEAGTTHRMPDYAHLACHAYSRTLRWSYGTNRNRRWDEWHQHVAGLPPAEMVRALSLAGFAGVYVDRRGFADNGDAVIGDLRGRLGPEVAASDSGEQLLFSLAPAVEDLRRYVDPADWEREKSRLLDRPCVLCQDGFFLWTAKMADEPRRAMHRAAMRLVNPGRETRSVTLSMAWRRMAADEIRVRSLFAKVWASISSSARRPRADYSNSKSSCRPASTFFGSTRRRSLWGCRGCSSRGMQRM